MSILMQAERIGQVPVNMAVEAMSMMDDSAAGWELIRQMDRAAFEVGYHDSRDGRPAQDQQTAAYTNGYCAGRITTARLAQTPAEFAAALADVEAGVSYCPAVDWAAVENDRIGD